MSFYHFLDEQESNRKKKARLKKKAKKKAAKKKMMKKSSKKNQKKAGAKASDEEDGEKAKDFEQEVAEAMAKQKPSDRDAAGADDRKRGYNSIYENKAPTEAEMEAYYRKRMLEYDPTYDKLLI